MIKINKYIVKIGKTQRDTVEAKDWQSAAQIVLKGNDIVIEETAIEGLEEAKENVKWLVDNSEGSVDMHGLSYWSSVVERLRKEAKSI